MRVRLENSDVWLTNVHNPSQCAGRPCTLHRRSKHHMRTWTQHWRSDRGIMERICPDCGCGHPDLDSPWENSSVEWIHGCCGACNPVIGCSKKRSNE